MKKGGRGFAGMVRSKAFLSPLARRGRKEAGKEEAATTLVVGTSLHCLSFFIVSFCFLENLIRSAYLLFLNTLIPTRLSLESIKITK